jgi:hypothetical protein
MKRNVFSLLLLMGVAAAPAVDGSAQTRAARSARVAKTAATAAAPAPVDVSSVFSVATGAERWAIEEPMPSKTVAFGGAALTLADRQVGVSTGSEGGYQLLFPVSWYPRYQEANPELKYVVVRYRDGRAILIIAEYNADRVSLPKEKFQRHPDGKTWYADLELVRQNGHVYAKQAISHGRPDGKGGLWVETIMLSCTPEK